MDKYEYKVRADEIKELIAAGEYAQAVEIADTIDWRRVKSVMMLCTISDLYKINRRYEDARDILLLAYERRPGGRTICYSLCELSIKMGEYIQAIEYCKEFKRVAPNDSGRYILQYKLYEAQDVSLEERIEVLEELKKRDYREKWAYELAYLYHRVGLATRCVEECDELILWFGEGKYVIKAMELKMLHQPLTPEQQMKYDMRFGEPVMESYAVDEQLQQEPQEVYAAESVSAEEISVSENGTWESSAETAVPEDIEAQATKEYKSITDEDLEIHVKTVDVGQFNTMNLQEELAESLKEVLGTERSAAEKHDAITRSIMEPMMDTDTETLDYPEIDEVDADDYKPEAEEIEASEVFFGETGEIASVPVAEDEAVSVDAVADVTGEIVMEQMRRESTGLTAQEVLQVEPPKELANVLSQEADGQLSLVMPESERLEKQITGQMNLADFFAEWERIKKEQKEKCKEEVRQRVLEQTGTMFTEFEAAVRDGLLEQLESGAVTADEIDARVAEGLSEEEVPEAEYFSEETTTEFEELEEIEEVTEPEESYDEDIKPAVVEEETAEETELPKEAVEKEVVVDEIPEEEPAAETESLAEETVAEGVVAEEAPEAEYFSEETTTEFEELEEIEEIEEVTESEESYCESIETAAVEDEVVVDEVPEEEFAAETESLAEETVAEEAVTEEVPETEYFSEETPEEFEEIAEIEEEAESEGIHYVRVETAVFEAVQIATGPEISEEESVAESESELPEEVSVPDEEEEQSKVTASEETAKRLSDDTAPDFEAIEETEQPVVRDKARVRSLTKEENEMFAPFIQSRAAREQLVQALDGISLAAYTGNVIITGEEGMDTLTLAKNMVREVQLTDSNFSGKIAKISGTSLNKKDVAATLNQLKNGALIIQKASTMNAETVKALHKTLQQESLGIVLVLEDVKKAMNKLLEMYPQLAACFTQRMDVEALSDEMLVAYGKKYAREQEYSIDDMGVLALHTRIGDMQTSDHVVTVAEIKEIVDQAIHHANRKTIGHFFDILFAKRYDEEDMIILTEKDFA